MESGIENFMTPDEMNVLGVASKSVEQRRILMKWGMKMYALGRHIIAEIEAIKYDGRLVILDDGTRWEVDDMDSVISSLWDPMDKVVVIDGEMYKLDETDKVNVEEEFI